MKVLAAVEDGAQARGSIPPAVLTNLFINFLNFEIMETNSSKNYSLDAILARDDYKRMTAQLKDKVQYIARRIYNKMEELDIYEPIRVDGVKIKCTSVCSSVGTYDFLAIIVESDYDECEKYQEWHSLEDVGRKYFYCGDFTAKVRGASNKEALAFLNAAKDFIHVLGEMEQKQADEIKLAIKETDGI